MSRRRPTRDRPSAGDRPLPSKQPLDGVRQRLGLSRDEWSLVLTGGAGLGIGVLLSKMDGGGDDPPRDAEGRFTEE